MSNNFRMSEKAEKELPYFLSRTRFEGDDNVFSTGTQQFNDKSQIDFLAEHRFGAIISLHVLDDELRQYAASKGLLLVDNKKMLSYGRGKSGYHGFLRAIAYFQISKMNVL